VNLITPVAADDPSAANDPVKAVAMSEKLAFTFVDEIFVPGVNVFGIL